VYSPCSNCDGTGLIRSIDSRSLELLRTISEISIRENIKKIDAEIPNEILNYLVNQKRNLLIDLENNKDASINFYGNSILRGNENKIRAFDLNNNEINLDKIVKNNDSIENKNDSKQNKKRKKGKNNKSNKLDHDNKNKINNKNKESNNTESKNINESDQNSVVEKKPTRKKSSKSTKNTGNTKKSKKDDNKIEKIKEDNKIPLIEDVKKYQDDKKPKNVNHIGAPIKGDEKKEKPKSGWWNKG
jgi:ribonuclease E